MEEEFREAAVGDGAAGSEFDVEEEESERGDSGVSRADEDRSGRRGNRPRNLGFRRPESQSGEERNEDEVDDSRDLGFRGTEEDRTDLGEEADEPEQEQEEARKEAEDVDDPRDLGFRRPEENQSEEQRHGREGDEAGEDEVDEREDQIEEQQREEEAAVANKEVSHLSFPPGRVRRIMKLDREISKVHSEALFLVSLSTELFLELLAEKAGAVALANKKKNVRVDHLLSATRSHTPIADFLLDSISLPAKTLPEAKQTPNIPKPLPSGSRRIDEFFSKPA